MNLKSSCKGHLGDIGPDNTIMPSGGFLDVMTDLPLGRGGPCAEKRRGEDVGVLQRLVLYSLHCAFNFSKLKGGALKKKCYSGIVVVWREKDIIKTTLAERLSMLVNKTILQYWKSPHFWNWEDSVLCLWTVKSRFSRDVSGPIWLSEHSPGLEMVSKEVALGNKSRRWVSTKPIVAGSFTELEERHDLTSCVYLKSHTSHRKHEREDIF